MSIFIWKQSYCGPAGETLALSLNSPNESIPKRSRGAFRAQFILLDDDLIGQNPVRDQRAHGIANQAGFQFFWQSSCHEALLLRHLDGCATLRPATTPLAEAALRHRWPEYTKGMSAADLAKRIDAAGVRRAAAVEPELATFLQAIDFQL